MSNITSLYQQTLDDLELRRARCLDDLRKIETAITGLRSAMEVAVNIPPAAETVTVHIATPSEVQREARQRYANMSVRWAVLKHLAEDRGFMGRPMKTADISESLTSGGNEKASKATVSAVISDMVNKRNELEQNEEGGYALTDNGRMAWNAIVHSARYINRASSANEQ